ncbi:CHAT domain-containing protein [Microcoleus sp. w1-18aA5]|uniref:CHAT domain-containing protein n=1 Tax=Microcoleus sp. w1-18aA5 TaxID=2818982 RepID=UPI002FD3E0D2
MRLHLVSVSFATLLLSLISPLLPSTLSLSPLVAQAQTNQDRKAIGDRLFREGEYLNAGRSYAAAIRKFQEALSIYQEIGDKASIGSTLYYIGEAHYSQEEYEQALDYFQQALPIRREVGDGDGELVTLNLMGKIYHEQGGQLAKQSQYRKALEKFQQLLVIQRKLGQKEAEGSTLNKIGIAYTNLGEYELALDFYQQALAIPPPYFAEDRLAKLFNAATLYEALGQYELALKLYQESLEISRERVLLVFDSRGAIGSIGGEVRNLKAIAGIHYRLEKYELALDFYQKSLAILKTIDDKTDKKNLEAGTLQSIGVVYLAQGKYELALKFLQEALTILKPLGYKESEGVMLSNIGQVYFEQGKYELAWDFYQQALVIFQEFGDKGDEGHALKNIGYLLEKQNQPELAIVFFKQSVNAREVIRKNIKGLPQEFQQSYTETIAKDYRHLADLLLKQDRVLEAQQVIDLLKIQELEDYLSNVRGNDQTAQGIPNTPSEQQIQKGYEALLNKAIQLGKELVNIEKIPPANRTRAQQQRILELRKNQQEISQQFQEFLKSPTVTALVAQLRQVTGGETLNLANFNSLRDNLQKLQQNAVILYPLVLDERLELILVTPYSPPIRRTVAVKREELNGAIADFRRNITNRNGKMADAEVAGQKLYQLLIKPIEKDLAQADAKTIIYAPDGQWRYIPLAALHDGKQWLVERFRINNITAASLTDFNTKPQNNLQVIAAAFTQGSYQFKVGTRDFTMSGLPFAGREVENLATTIPGTMKLLDNQFNRDTVLLMNDYSIVHLATHAAFLVGEPEDSFIMFGNGDRATLREIKTWSLPKVDLIVLSACQTAVGGRLGNGEEILGFGYQVQRTGARAAISTLWYVDDGGTQVLMDAFYAALKQENMTKAEALRQAQIALITGNSVASGQQPISSSAPSEQSNSLSHPFYWAPFILIGNGL